MITGEEDCTEDILGYQVSSCIKDSCVRKAEECIAAGASKKYAVCVNPHSLVQAKADSLFRQAIKEADLILPDGAGIVLASRILNGEIRERVTGSDLFFGLSESLNATGGASYFFLGSTHSNLLAIKEKLGVDFPNIRVAGMYSPPFKEKFSPEDNRLMIDAISEANPDVLWVGMTAPKQEKWIAENRGRLNVKFIAAVGAVFDFYTGKVKRPHPFFQRMGLEWLPRLIREPSRLWKRTFVSVPILLWDVAVQWVKRRSSRN